MMLTDAVYAQAVLLTGQLEERQSQLLQILCTAAASSLEARLRDGITPEDCKADFIAAASLLALAALSEADETAQMDQISAGDITFRRGSTDSAACCLRYQAEVVMTPYLKDNFTFMGV